MCKHICCTRTQHKVTLQAHTLFSTALSPTNKPPCRASSGRLSPSGARHSFRRINHANLSHILINHLRLCVPERMFWSACIMFTGTWRCGFRGISTSVCMYCLQVCSMHVIFLCVFELVQIMCFLMLARWMKVSRSSF